MSHDFVDHFRGAGRRFDYTWEERWARDQGYSKIIPEAVNGLLAKLGLDPEQPPKTWEDYLAVAKAIQVIVGNGGCGPPAVDDCVGSSTNADPAAEAVTFTAESGQTYHIVIDGRSDATSAFSLAVTTPPTSFRLNEVGSDSPDFVEIINRGACAADAARLQLEHVTECDSVSFTFPAGSTVAAGAVLRLVDTDAIVGNEIFFGANFCDTGYGVTSLCSGACDDACSTLMDHLERSIDGTDPGGPACAGFDPAPVDTSALGANAVRRAAFAGAAPGPFQQADWTTGPPTRE